jgi:hypothetical protein
VQNGSEKENGLNPEWIQAVFATEISMTERKKYYAKSAKDFAL